MVKYFITEKKTGEVNYIVKVKKNSDDVIEYRLFRSNSNMWTSESRNKKVITAIDTGNSIIIEKPDEDSRLVSGYYDFDEIDELNILLTVMKKHDKYFAPKYKIIKA